MAVCTVLLLIALRAGAREDGDLPADLVHQYVGAFFTDADHGYVYSDDVITATSDGGATWRVVHEGSHTSLFLLDLQTFWFFARGVDLYTTRDGGRHFTVHRRPTYRDPQSGEQESVSGGLFVQDARDGWIVNVRSLLRTRDGGATWNATELPRGLGESHQVRMFGGGDGIAVESFHPVIRTTDGGTTWTSVPNSPKLALLSCTAAGFCAGATGLHGPVFISKDRGQTWVDAQAPLELPDRDAISQIQAVGPMFVVLVGSHADWSFQNDVRPFIDSRTPLPHHAPPAGLLLTWNGAHWMRIVHDFPRRISGLSFLSPQVGWLVSDANNLIFKTADGGKTLTFVPDYFRQIAPPTPTLPVATTKPPTP